MTKLGTPQGKGAIAPGQPFVRFRFVNDSAKTPRPGVDVTSARFRGHPNPDGQGVPRIPLTPIPAGAGGIFHPRPTQPFEGEYAPAVQDQASGVKSVVLALRASPGSGNLVFLGTAIQVPGGHDLSQVLVTLDDYERFSAGPPVTYVAPYQFVVSVQVYFYEPIPGTTDFTEAGPMDLGPYTFP